MRKLPLILGLAAMILATAAAINTLLAGRGSFIPDISLLLSSRSSLEKTAMGEDSTKTWKTFSANNFSYKYPESLVRLSNPRGISSSPTVQYYLLNEDAADEYIRCLEIGREQYREYEQTGKTPEEWIDWEGRCDIMRVVFTVFSTFSLDFPSPDLLIYEITDAKQRKWLVYLAGGIGDEIWLTAIHTSDPKFMFEIRSHERALQKFLEAQTPPSEAQTNQDYTKYLEKVLVQMLSTLIIGR